MTFDLWIIGTLRLYHLVWTSSRWFLLHKLKEIDIRSIAIESIKPIHDFQRSAYGSLLFTGSLFDEKLVDK